MPAKPRYEVGAGFRRERGQLAAPPSCIRVNQVDESLGMLGIVEIGFYYSNVQCAAQRIGRSAPPHRADR